MLSCINKSSVEYQSLKQKAGIPEYILESVCRGYITRYNRFPFLDELPGANSEPALRQNLEINQYGGVQIDQLLNTLGTANIEQIAPEINNNYRDLEVSITPISKQAIVDIKHRPTSNNTTKPDITIDISPNPTMFFETSLDRLRTLYGVNIISTNDAELNSESFKSLPQECRLAKGFIYKGNVYINTDKASVDTPIHEFMHLLIGSLRFSNTSIYQSLLDSIELLPDYQAQALKHPNRSRNDVNEEILVTEISKYLSRMPSSIDKASDSIKHEIIYNVNRILDSIFMGQDSVSTIAVSDLFNMNFKEIANTVGSSAMNNKNNFAVSEVHRELNNIKSELIKNNQLQEVCE